jgi:hypothetical protein
MATVRIIKKLTLSIKLPSDYEVAASSGKRSRDNGAKNVFNVDPRRFYRDVQSFGFLFCFIY